MIRAATKPKRDRRGRKRNRVTPLIIERAQRIHELLSPHGVSERGALGLAKRNLTPEDIEARFQRLMFAGAPATNLSYTLGLTLPKFDKVIARYEKLHGLTDRQAGVVAFLFREGVSQNVIIEVLEKMRRGAQFSIKRMKGRLTFFNSFELDPERYGVTRIPLSEYEHFFLRRLPYSTHTSKQATNTGVELILRKLEDKQAAKALSRRVPNWVKSKTLAEVRPATLLERAKACEAIGIKPTVPVIGKYSAKSIREGKAGNHTRRHG